MPAKELSAILHGKIAQIITAVIDCSKWANQSLQSNPSSHYTRGVAETAEGYRASEYAERSKRPYSRGGAETAEGAGLLRELRASA